MKKILDKAVKGGWTYDGYIHKTSERIAKYANIERIIFSHDFLKAFFGEEIHCYVCGGTVWDNDPRNPLTCLCHLPQLNKSWQYHAQQLVLSTDRKKYLKRFI